MNNLRTNIANILGISKATLQNWQNLNLAPQIKENTDIFYYVSQVKEKIENIKLNSRANRSKLNKNFTTYNSIACKNRQKLLQNIIIYFQNLNQNIEIGVISLIYTMLKNENLLSRNWFKNPNTRIEINLKNWVENLKTDPKIILKMFENFEIKNENDDFLGAFYQSIKSMAQNSKNGSFYTPKKLLQNLKIKENQKIYDPSCGSGNILLNILPENFDTSLIFASDIDDIALKICETNLVLYFNNPNIKSKIFKRDFLNFESNEKYDFIITNPPWGAKFNINEKAEILKKYKFLRTTESFSIFLFNIYKMLNQNGKLWLFLPQSFLNVGSHAKIRNFILSKQNKISIYLLGNAFKNVVSKAILLNVDLENFSEILEIYNQNEKILVEKSKCQKSICLQNEKDRKIIEKIYNFSYTTLKNNADFALGIVTGNNKFFIENNQNDENEMIFRGKNILPFRLEKSDEFIKFQPKNFQQVAPLKFYRNRKIVYRFICDKIICAISENNELMLNSANIFIPKNYPFESIVSLFNSEIYAFLFKNKFDTIKILRNQIEELPLPNFNQKQHEEIKILYQKHIKNNFNFNIELDNLIAKFLNLTENEMKYIREKNGNFRK